MTLFSGFIFCNSILIYLYLFIVAASLDFAVSLRIQKACGCEIVPHLSCETKMDFTKYHTCHAQCCGITRDQGVSKPDPNVPSNAMSATPFLFH